MAFKTPNVTSEYIRELLVTPKNTILEEILAYADERMIPALLPETAAFLRQMVMLSRPKKVLEIGTGAGYSLHTILYAHSEATVHSVDISEENVDIAKMFLHKSNFSDRVRFFIGDASEIVPMIEAKYDLIFLDGPKARYYDYLPFLKRCLVRGGLLICDNVLYDGMVSGEHTVSQKKVGLVKRIDLFLRTLCNDDDFDTSILPIGDGISLSIKNK